MAYNSAKLALPDYSHPKSPHKFTQPQLVTCLVLKEFFKKDYRGVEAILTDSSDLQKILELKEIPHYTTLQKSAARLLRKDKMDKLIQSILYAARKSRIQKKVVDLAAVDSTGFESRHISSYFVKRRDRDKSKPYQTTTYTRFPKLGLVADTANHLIISAQTGRGPKPDVAEFKPALAEALKFKGIKCITADAGYDSESNHIFARLLKKVRSIIPPKVGRPTDKLPSGKFRKLMTVNFPKEIYGQRWQVETVNSMIKRNLNSFLRAKTFWSQSRELMLKVFTHNIMIVWCS